MQGGKAQLTWRCTWRWGWRWWRAGRLMLLSPPLFSSWCSSSLPSLCPLFLYFYGFLPLLWSLSLSLLCLLCFCSVFFLCVTCVCSFSSLGFLVLSLSPASSVYFFYAFPSFSPCLRLRPPVLPSCSRFSARRPSVQGAVQPDTGLVLVRWLANASLCFCLVCFSSRPLVFFCVLPPLVFVLSLFCRFCFWRLVLKKDEVDGDVEVWFSLYFFFLFVFPPPFFASALLCLL